MALWDTEMEDVLQIFEVLLLSCAITNIKAVLCHSEGNSGKKETTSVDACLMQIPLVIYCILYNVGLLSGDSYCIFLKMDQFRKGKHDRAEKAS